ncbi:MAG: 3-hydroxyacyl-CoA dehydrogenase [Burkholderiaceae bacterium]
MGIVGSGAMGRGIAQIAAQAGITVLLFDTNADAVALARRSIGEALEKLVGKGKLEASAATAALERLKPVAALSELSAAQVIVEAIVEKLESKRELFAALEACVAAEVVLASNTSSLSITAIASVAEHPERIVGWHFFNPVPLMKVVEVVDGLSSSPQVGDAMMELSRRVGHTPVRAKDTPGFIVNHAGRGFGTEALRIVGEGVCEFVDVDRVMREGCGFRLGPFELMDLTSLDVSHPVMESIYHQFYEEPRFRPSVITAQRYAGRVWGRKTQRGFYDYSPSAAAVPEAPQPGALPKSVWISAADPGRRERVLAALGSSAPVTARAAEAAVCVVLPLGEDTTTSALAEGLDPQRTVALDTLAPLGKRLTLMTNPKTATEVRDQAHALFAQSGANVTVIRDSPGFIAQRILATIVNIASDIAQQQIATPSDIDLAVRLGLNYPNGPLAMGDALGPERVLTILRNLQQFYGDPRYRPSPWLIRRAALGMSLTETGT